MSPSSPPTTDGPALWETYKYTPTERGIFTPSPYKDRLLPLWRFRTPDLARVSAEQIWSVFREYEQQDDFVGMDNARKFLQMGMTRAKRYANHKGGKKYAAGESAKVEAEENAGIKGGRKKRRKLDQSTDETDWEGRQEKVEASLVFKEAWEKAKTCEGYVRRKQEFLEKQNGQRIEQEPIDGEPNDRNMALLARLAPEGV